MAWKNNYARTIYPSLYNIIRPKHVTIGDVLGVSPPKLSWRMDLIGRKSVAWNNLLPLLFTNI